MPDRSTFAERLGARMREAAPPMSPRQHAEGRARLMGALAPQPRRGRARVAFAALTFAAVAAAIALLVLRRAAPAPLAWHVEHGSVSVGAQGYVSVPGGASNARIVFDDGSDVSLSAGSRARVASTTAVGAEVVLEQGRANIHVVHREGAGEHTKWLFDAGPYAVQVTGTEFVVAWVPHAGALDVWMRSGRVVIKGPLLGDALALGAGQHLFAKLNEGAVQIDGAPAPPEEAPPAPPPPAPSSAPSAPPAPIPTADAPAPHGSIAPRATPWSALVASGDYARVVHEADAEGIAHVLAARSLDDLHALGDAARYGGRTDVARRAYGALRARFPSRVEAHTAAFLLGRLEEEQRRDDAAAIRWYDAYLTEAPRGVFAGDALGRKMVLVSRTSGRGAARPLAERYLRLYAGGPYDAAARGLVP